MSNDIKAGDAVTVRYPMHPRTIWKVSARETWIHVR